MAVGLGAAVTVALGLPGSVQAQPLIDVLAETCLTNPTLAAQRESLRGSNEAIAQALSEYRPSVSADASVGTRWSQDRVGAIDGSETINPATIGITVEQPLYSFGREAGVEAANFGIQAARANYLGTEQSVFLDAVTAYMNVVQAQSLLSVAFNNENVLRRQLQATQDRFEVGEVTRTDVAQAQASVAGAVALVVQNQGQLEDARAVFEQVVGFPPGDLTQPDVPTNLPVSLEEAVVLSERNPSVVSAEFTELAATEQIEVQEGTLLPSFSVVGTARHSTNPSALIDRQESAEVSVRMAWQLYAGGLLNSQVRQQRYLAGQRGIEVDETRRATVANTISAWESLVTARANITSFRSQVSANAVALEGVQQEALVGTRTVLDVLDAEQAVLDSQSSLIESRRDEIVAAYTVLAQVGLLTANDLGLPGCVYDFGPDYERTRDRWFGNSVVE